MHKEYDIIVYGASGFTAKHVIARLAETEINLAVAGRNYNKIKANLSGIKELPILVAPIEDIRRITAQTRILVNCAGPYQLCGEEVVRACIHTNTHYLDITGETYFIEKIIDLFGKIAKERNIYIINCCGFDSIPSDIGVQVLKNAMNTSGCEYIRCDSVMRMSGAYINHTTYDSVLYGLQNVEKMRLLRKKNLKPSSKPKRKQLKKVFYNELTNSYNVIFMGTDASVVKRSQLMLAEECSEDPVEYYATFDVGSIFTCLKFLFYFSIIYILSKFRLGMSLLFNYPSFFTGGRVRKNGPTKEDVESASFEIIFKGEMLKNGVKSERILRVSGPDPGYITTSICVSTCALLLLEKINKKDESKFKGGVLTPACAFYGTDIVDRLRNKGIMFKME
ncbi:Saccharopine dehydrogenase-like oxidoreductase [Astathelohania contejeani]|uniref:Saccharopine dehydrogenase-like oxidoreductase n=1 Tax=Astathelohania contejeani TaxID=164912 RepID=A0ABQ7HVY1_9MICR|nr:Saccharopine dehydrogenase-like oxidoreductase [Thelohania contejeani]